MHVARPEPGLAGLLTCSCCAECTFRGLRAHAARGAHKSAGGHRRQLSPAGYCGRAAIQASCHPCQAARSIASACKRGGFTGRHGMLGQSLGCMINIVIYFANRRVKSSRQGAQYRASHGTAATADFKVPPQRPSQAGRSVPAGRCAAGGAGWTQACALQPPLIQNPCSGVPCRPNGLFPPGDALLAGLQRHAHCSHN